MNVSDMGEAEAKRRWTSPRGLSSRCTAPSSASPPRCSADPSFVEVRDQGHSDDIDQSLRLSNGSRAILCTSRCRSSTWWSTSVHRPARRRAGLVQTFARGWLPKGLAPAAGIHDSTC
ncbi:hypothetical protein QJS66_05470 [Kocuria rhizophila]|nr:hypothetical protein QJS66_05470 [Kocuria rhizophila]